MGYFKNKKKQRMAKAEYVGANTTERKGFFGRQFDKVKDAASDELSFRREVRMAEKESYRKARLNAAKKSGYAKVKNEARGFNFKGFAGPSKSTPTPSLGLGDFLNGSKPKEKSEYKTKSYVAIGPRGKAEIIKRRYKVKKRNKNNNKREFDLF